MLNFGLRQKIIAAGTVTVIVLIVYLRGNYQKSITSIPAVQPTPRSTSTPSPSDKPQVVSTKPDPLDEAFISTTEVVEITFNRPLENVGEFKVKIEPELDYKAELSGDRKTAKILPVKPYQLGTTYTLSIGTESKFDGVGRWGEEKSFHFKTIKYSGI